MAYFDNPLIPIRQQAPSGMTITPADPLSSAFAYWNAQVADSVFQNVAGTTPATIAGQEVQNWKELINSPGINDATEAADPPILGTDGILTWIDFEPTRNALLSVGSSTDKFNFLHNGEGGEIIVVALIDVDAPNSVLVCNNRNTLSDIGVCFGVLSLSAQGNFAKKLDVMVSNGTTAPVRLMETQGGYIAGVKSVHDFSYKESATPKNTFEVNNIDVIDLDEGVGSPTASNAAFDLVLGARLLIEPMIGQLYSVAIFNEVLTSRKRQAVTSFLAESALFEVKQTEIFPEGYNDFLVSNDEVSYTHPNLPYCTHHNITVASDSPSSNVEVTVTFFIGEIVSKVEKLTDTGVNYELSGITRIGYKTETTSETAIARSWSQ